MPEVDRAGDLARVVVGESKPEAAGKDNWLPQMTPSATCHEMTKTLKDLLAEKAELDAAIAKAHKGASEQALAQVRELVSEFGFTAQQVFPWKLPAKPKVAAKYLDEKSGATWSGRGKPPAWIAGKNRDDFLIERSVPAQREGGPLLAEMAAAAARNSR